MAEPDSSGPHQRHHHHDERSNLRAAIANLRGAGIPWWQALAKVASNVLLRVVPPRSCCGNYGQPGC